MEGDFLNLCQNLTKSNESELQNCHGYNNTRTNVTLEVSNQNNVEEATNVDLDLQVKYYCEGVILVPLAIFGLFGR